MNIRRTTIYSFLIALMISSSVTGQDFQPTREILIETPSPCTKLERYDEPKVYLVEPAVCEKEGTLGTISVQFRHSTVEAEVFLNNEFWKKQEIRQITRTTLANIHDKNLEKQEEIQKWLNENSNPHKEKGEELARDARQQAYSGGLMDNVTSKQTEIAQEFFPDQYEKAAKETGQAHHDMSGSNLLATDERVYLFISKSMPVDTLREYVKQFNKAGDTRAIMVLNGFIDGGAKILPTINFMTEILKKDPLCKNEGMMPTCDAYVVEIIIDPTLFNRYKVTEVPTIVYAQGVNQLSGLDGGVTEGLEDNFGIDRWWGFKGAATSIYTLGRINKEAQSSTLQAFIDKMESGFYQ